MECPCGYGYLSERLTTSGHRVLVCDEHNEVYLSESEVGKTAPLRWNQDCYEIAHGLHFVWPPLPDEPTVGFRVWMAPGVPLEAERAAIVRAIDHHSLLPTTSDSARPDRSGTIQYSPEWHSVQGTKDAQIRFAYSREPARESIISGRLLEVNEHDLLDRMVAVMENHGGLFAVVAADLTIEKRVGSLFAATAAHGQLKDTPFGLATHGLPGLGWRAIFGPAYVNEIGIDNFEALGEFGTQHNDLWIINSATDIADTTQPERTDLEDLIINQLGTDYFHTYDNPEQPTDDDTWRTEHQFRRSYLPSKFLQPVTAHRPVMLLPHAPYHDTWRINMHDFDWRTHGAYEIRHPDGTIEPGYDHHELRVVKHQLEQNLNNRGLNQTQRLCKRQGTKLAGHRGHSYPETMKLSDRLKAITTASESEHQRGLTPTQLTDHLTSIQGETVLWMIDKPDHGLFQTTLLRMAIDAPAIATAVGPIQVLIQSNDRAWAITIEEHADDTYSVTTWTTSCDPTDRVTIATDPD